MTTTGTHTSKPGTPSVAGSTSVAGSAGRFPTPVSTVGAVCGVGATVKPKFGEVFDGVVLF